MSADDARRAADARRARREAATAAARAVIAEFGDELHRVFESAPPLEAIWIERLASRVADLMLRRRLYAWRADRDAFFVVAESEPAAEAAIAAALRTRPTSAAPVAWPDGYALTVADAGEVLSDRAGEGPATG